MEKAGQRLQLHHGRRDPARRAHGDQGAEGAHSLKHTEYLNTTQIVFFKGVVLKRKSPHGNLKQGTGALG